MKSYLRATPRTRRIVDWKRQSNSCYCHQCATSFAYLPLVGESSLAHHTNTRFAVTLCNRFSFRNALCSSRTKVNVMAFGLEKSVPPVTGRISKTRSSKSVSRFCDTFALRLSTRIGECTKQIHLQERVESQPNWKEPSPECCYLICIEFARTKRILCRENTVSRIQSTWWLCVWNCVPLKLVTALACRLCRLCSLVACNGWRCTHYVDEIFALMLIFNKPLLVAAGCINVMGFAHNETWVSIVRITLSLGFRAI